MISIELQKRALVKHPNRTSMASSRPFILPPNNERRFVGTVLILIAKQLIATSPLLLYFIIKSEKESSMHPSNYAEFDLARTQALASYEFISILVIFLEKFAILKMSLTIVMLVIKVNDDDCG